MSQEHGGRVNAYAIDIRGGDVVYVRGERDPLKVISRNYPPVTNPMFKVRLEGGATRSLPKLAHVEIEDDADGSVAARVLEINAADMRAAMMPEGDES